MASEPNEVEPPPAGQRRWMVTVRLGDELHRRLLAVSHPRGAHGKPMMNQFCIAAIEAALDDGASTRDRERSNRIALEARFGARFDALDADDLAREAAEIAGGNLLLNRTPQRHASPLLREFVFERWAQIEADKQAESQQEAARQTTP